MHLKILKLRTSKEVPFGVIANLALACNLQELHVHHNGDILTSQELKAFSDGMLQTPKVENTL